MPSADQLNRPPYGIAGAFLVQGLLFIAMTTHLPAMQHKFGLGELQLSLVLLGMVLLAGLGSVIAERVASRRGSAMALRWGLLGLGAGAAVVGLAPSPGTFAAGIGAYGTAVGVVDAASNMQGVALEHRRVQTLLPRLHAGWTCGGILATVLALAAGDASLSVAIAPVAVLPVLLTVAPLEPHDHGRTGESVPVPWRRIALVGLALVLFYSVDTAAATWGPVYLHTVHGLAVGSVAWATLPYLAASLIARVGAVFSLRRMGIVATLRVGGLVAAAALLGLVLAPGAYAAILAFAVLGLGVGVIAPLSFSAAALIAGGGVTPQRAQVDAVIARFNQFNYVGALLGAVMTGVVGKGNLRLGFAVPAVLILGIWPLARSFTARDR